MTNQEMLGLLKGNIEQKQMLYDYFCNKVSQGETLADNEVPLFDAARKELTKKSEVVTMSGHATGSGGTSL